MRQSKINEQNRYLEARQHDFWAAADVITAALASFSEVVAIAVIGSVAKPLWKEVPRFREFRIAGVGVWHECADLDLAVWLDSLERLGDMRRAFGTALRVASESGKGPSIAGHQADVFLFEPASDRYLGRLCSFTIQFFVESRPLDSTHFWISLRGSRQKHRANTFTVVEIE